MGGCTTKARQGDGGEGRVEVRALARAPGELTRGRLVRLGEGIGKVVYASEHWVVKRERHPSEIITLICVWKLLTQLDRVLPGGLGRRLLKRPGKQVRFLRLIFHAALSFVPKGVWLATHVGAIWRSYASREIQGEMLANAYLAGTPIVPQRIAFPPTRVKVGRWPGWLVVSEATERVEMTLHDRINDLARARRFDDIGLWLDRFLDLRRAGWKHGVFSLDAHLKNFGVIGDRVVLLDAGGLTNRWPEIDAQLGFEDEFASPHVQLGLEMTLRDRPDIAERFDAHWRATVNPAAVRHVWPAEVPAPAPAPAADGQCGD